MTSDDEYSTGRCVAPGCSAGLLSERQQRPIRDSSDGRNNSTAKTTVGVRICAAGHEQRDYYT
jgi:hypothetical protein